MTVSKKISVIFLLVLISLDQLSKFWARNYLKPLSVKDFIPKFLEFKYAENTGMAFSYLANHPLILTILISIISIILLILLFRSEKTDLFLIFITAGAISNLLDRYFFGFVTDFINPVFINFAIFNLADVFLNIGLYIYIFELFFNKEKPILLAQKN